MMKVTLHDGCLIIGALQVIATCIGAVSCISVLASGDVLQNLVDTYCDGNYNYTDMDDFCNPANDHIKSNPI